MDQILDENLNERTPETYTIASKGKRFVNLIIDYLGLFAIAFIIALLYQIFFASEEGQEEEMNPLLSQLLIVVLYCIFLFLQEAYMNGRTFGKWVTGTKVLDESGQKPTRAQLLKRNFCRAIPFDGLSFLGNAGWHDTISKTVVVDTRAKR